MEVALSGNAWIVIPCYHVIGDTRKLKYELRKKNLMIIDNCEHRLTMKAAAVATLRWIRMTGGDLQF